MDQLETVRTWKDVITLRHFCIALGSLICLEEGFHIGQKLNSCKASSNFDDDESEWCTYRDLPIILALRIPAIIAAALLVVGAKKVSIRDREKSVYANETNSAKNDARTYVIGTNDSFIIIFFFFLCVVHNIFCLLFFGTFWV